MSIRTRLTLTLTVLTAALAALSVWLGSQLLGDMVASSALDAQLENLEILIEGDFVEGELVDEDFSEGSIIAGTGFDRDFELSVREQLQFLFLPEQDWIPAIESDTLNQLIDEFGTDDRILVSSLGLEDLSADPGELVWPVDRTGIVGPAQPGDLLPDGAVVVPGLNLFELIDFEALDDFGFDQETGEVLFDDDSTDDGLRLVFDRVEIGGVSYGLAADAADELSAINEVTGILWFAAGALAVLAGLATWVVAGRALAPVDALTRRVDEITSARLDERLPASERGDEIGRLAGTMNRMLERLETSDRQRRRFVSDASHELRTPLTVLANQAEVARSAPDTTSLDAFAQVVDGETSRLASIVEDLLALARHDELALSEESEARSEVFDLDDVLLAEAARKRRLPVDRSAVSAGRVRGDASTSARAIAHLLDNAARHGSSKIAVGLVTLGDRVHLTVEDDGAGIAESDRADVFQRFTRLDDARTRDHGGAGLGLSVVRVTFTRMGGSVSVDRSPLGGARFLVVLPAAGVRPGE